MNEATMTIDIDYQKEIDNCSEWIGNYVRNNGMEGIVVGLSGGIDSSVICCLAVKAMGIENVKGVRLPCETRADMNTDAKELAENLGIQLLTVDLDGSFMGIVSELSETLNPESGSSDWSEGISTLTQANIKARLRMTALYAIANQSNYLVAGTGNKSELDVGYFTKFGDGGVDLEPLGNYYKGEVYKMAELMPEIPESIKTKAPSADLYQGQTDEQELGMSYPDLDDILKGINGDRKLLDRAEVLLLEKVQYMIRIARHKNNVPPRYLRE
jgi:NAD+ synthase